MATSDVAVTQKTHKQGWIGSTLVIIIERALDFFGVTSMIIGTGLFLVAFVLAIWWVGRG